VDYFVALDCWYCQLYFAHLDLFSCYHLGCDITHVPQEPELMMVVMMMMIMMIRRRRREAGFSETLVLVYEYSNAWCHI